MNGLSTQEVVKRRSRGLGNRDPVRSSRSYLQIIRENVFTFVNLVLFGLGPALVLLGRPGDILVLRPGDQVVADGQVVDDATAGAGRAELDESLLTGESDLIRKQ